MNANDIILVIVSGLGVIHGLFLAIFLWSYSKGNRLSNRLLSLLLVALSLRVGKSVFLEFTEELDVKIIFSGLSIIMVIGPLFLMYVRSVVDRNFKFQSVYLVQFIPAVIGFIFGLWLNKEHLDTLPILLFAFLFLFYYFHLLSYLIMSFVFILKNKSNLEPELFRFLRLMIFGLLIIWAAYVLNLFDEVIPYVFGPVLYSAVAYILSFIVFKRGYIQRTDTKYKTTPVSDEQQNQIFSKVLKLIEEDKIYKDPDLTLKSMSAELRTSTQILSLVINQKSSQNFNSFINSYRIKEAIEMFQLKEFQNLTISAIAFEAGFNSISSFNTAFKKETGKTPQAYKNKLIK